MERVLVPLNWDNISRIPDPCRTCVNWELGPAGAAGVSGQADFEKEVWLSGVLLQWGSCGQLLEVDGEVVAFALFAPPTAVPAAVAFPSGPVSPDAALLVSARVLPQHRGRGHGRHLVQGVARELTRRGVRALEVFARRGHPAPGAEPVEVPTCLVAAQFAEAVGFTEVGPHPYLPRLRLDSEAALDWKADVEAALDKLFTTVVLPMAPVGRPAHAGR